jgi:hypothetical protein
MESGWSFLTVALGFLWFLAYWIFGGVFFALITVLRLGRVKKVRFSCLFTLLCAACGAFAAKYGLQASGLSISDCLDKAQTKAEAFSAVFGCGFAGVFGTFLVGAAAMVLGGFLIMAISRSQQRPWIVLETGSGTLETMPSEPAETPADDHGHGGHGGGHDGGHAAPGGHH